MTVSPVSPVTATTNANTHFSRWFGAQLPSGLRAQGTQLSWDHFVAVYGRSPGRLRLNQWACLDAERPAGRRAPQGNTYRATITVGDRVVTCTAAASGPVGALTTMLYEQGIAVEMVRFHQYGGQYGGADHTATFVYGSDGRCGSWAIGMSPDRALSAVEAVVICANRLLLAG